MKKILVLPILLLLAVPAFCQNKSISHKDVNQSYHTAGDFSIALAPNVLFNTPNGKQFAGGIKLRYFVGKRLSFDTDVVFSKDYCHLGMGLVGIPLAIFCLGSLSDSDTPIRTLLGGIAAIAISLEHTAYHIPISRVADISPYVSLLRYKYAETYGGIENPDRHKEQLCCAAGIELNRYYNRFVLSPYCEVNMGYKDHIPGVNAGLYLGYYFIPRSR